MTDIRTESLASADKEAGPATKFGTALVGFADRMDALAGKETNLTHRQLWLALGTEAVVGAVAIAIVGSENTVNSKEIIRNLVEETEYRGESWTIDWGYREKIGDFVRKLIEGGFKDEAGKSVFLLDSEATAGIVEQLDRLEDLESKRDQLRNLLMLGGFGSTVMAVLSAKAGEKVKVSAPVGKVPAVLPTIANAMRGIGRLF